MNRKTRRAVCSKPIYLCKAKNNKQLEVDFKGGDISSDAGVLLLSKIDKRLGLLKNVASGLEDIRVNADAAGSYFTKSSRHAQITRGHRIHTESKHRRRREKICR